MQGLSTVATQPVPIAEGPPLLLCTVAPSLRLAACYGLERSLAAPHLLPVLLAPGHTCPAHSAPSSTYLTSRDQSGSSGLLPPQCQLA